MKKIWNTRARTVALGAVSALALAACGGGGGDSGGGGGGFVPIVGGSSGGGNGAGTSVAVKGTVARGAMLPGAVVSMTCANGAKISSTADGTGTYSAPAVALTYPCIGTAKSGPITYRGILFSGGIANFTPATDAMVEVALAAAASGAASLSADAYLAKVSGDGTFANNATSGTNAALYRDAVIAAIKALLLAGGKSNSEAEAILSAFRSMPFDQVLFLLGTELDVVLDRIAPFIQDGNGNLIARILAECRDRGNGLPTPPSGATGATGVTGAVGG